MIDSDDYIEFLQQTRAIVKYYEPYLVQKGNLTSIGNKMFDYDSNIDSQ